MAPAIQDPLNESAKKNPIDKDEIQLMAVEEAIIQCAATNEKKMPNGKIAASMYTCERERK